ncbi:hypothetical protein KJ596_03795 [Patescibacteria group bacterium]|nr:hypothetical protein [Patescibacteria group bacterium]MBU1868398.1 hypothetical protein [Patescibacteria group bacterium]
MISPQSANETAPAPTSGELLPSNSPKRKLLLLFIALAFICAIITIILGTITATSLFYKLPFLNSKQKVALMSLTSRIPLIPKSNSQILLNAITSTPVPITSSQNQTSLAIKIGPQDNASQSSINFSLETNSTLDLNQPQNPKGEFRTRISLAPPVFDDPLYSDLYQGGLFSSMNAEVEGKFVDRILYIKIKDVQGLDFLWTLIDFPQEQVLNLWFAVDLGDIATDWSANNWENPWNIAPPQQISELKEETSQKTLYGIIGSGILDQVERKDETINGRRTWHFSLSKQDNTLQKFLYKIIDSLPAIIEESGEEEIMGSFEKNFNNREYKEEIDKILAYLDSAEIHFYIDKNMLYLSGISANATIVNLSETQVLPNVLGTVNNAPDELYLSDYLNYLAQDLRLEVNLDIKNTNINEPVNVTAPESYQSIDTLLEITLGKQIKLARDAVLKANLSQCITWIEISYVDNINKYPSTPLDISDVKGSPTLCRAPEGREDIFPAAGELFGYKTLNDSNNFIIYAQLEKPSITTKEYYIYQSLEGTLREVTANELLDLVGQLPELNTKPTQSPSSSSFRDLLD